MCCFEALLATGTCENLPGDVYLDFMIEQNKFYPMHKDAATLVKYYDKVDEFFEHLNSIILYIRIHLSLENSPLVCTSPHRIYEFLHRIGITNPPHPIGIPYKSPQQEPSHTRHIEFQGLHFLIESE